SLAVGGDGLGLERAADRPLVPLVHDRDLIPARVLRPEGLELGPVPVALEVDLALEGVGLPDPVAVLARAQHLVLGRAVAQCDRRDLVDVRHATLSSPYRVVV